MSYIHEPFHIWHDLDVCAARFEHWFTYVCEKNEAPYVEPVRDMLLRNADLPLVKDPIAVFSVEWLARRFRVRPVVLIRHPAAFAVSVKDKGWTHPFAHFLAQPLLMARHLDPCAREIMRFARAEQDILDQAALLWRLIYSVVTKYQSLYPDWIYIRHEDLARDPLSSFRVIFGALGLEFREETERAIEAQRRTDLDRWRLALTPAEIERVKAGVAGVSDLFYADEEWSLRG